MYKKIAALVFFLTIFWSCTSRYNNTVPALENVQSPRLMKAGEMNYPWQAKKLGLEGKVNLFLLVSDQGEVIKVRIRKSSGSDILDDAAREYAKQLKFHPALKNGKPITIWLTWTVSYNLVEKPPLFQPEKYVRKIKRLMQQARQSSGEARERIFDEILDSHEQYVMTLQEASKKNFNSYVREFILPTVFDQWKALWQEVPLPFVVFQDFMLRYPQTDKIPTARIRLIELVKQTIKNIKAAAQQQQMEPKKKDEFLKIIYRFLNENYPEALTGDWKLEAERYLGKN